MGATKAATASPRTVRGITDYHSAVTLARPTLRIATYNVHSCRGLDRRTRPERTAAVLRAIDADIVALQEVIGPGSQSGGTPKGSFAPPLPGPAMAPPPPSPAHPS